MRNTFIIWLLLSIILFGQDIHYPFTHDYSHSGTNTSNCREYAMARAYGGSYCPNTKLGNVANSVSGSHWNNYTWNTSNIAVGDIVLWGTTGGLHAAYVVAKDGNSYQQIRVDQVPAPGQAVETNKTLWWVIQNTAAVNGGSSRTNVPSNYARKNPNWELEIYNQFSDGTTGGNISVNGNVVSTPYTITGHWGTSHTISAIYDNQLFNGKKWALVNWNNDGTDENGPATKSFSIVQSSSSINIVANYHRLWSIELSNEFNGGTITVNGDPLNSPANIDVAENGSFIAIAINQTLNGIQYTFDNWNTGSTNNPETFYPNGDLTYTANFTGTPTQVQNVHDTGANYQPIQLAWTAHPNPIVRYELWRIAKDLTGVRDTSQIASLSNSTATYTDYSYDKLPRPSHILHYDVRAYYPTDQTYATPDWYLIAGGHAPKIISENNTITPDELTVGAYPNPFNPTTEIKFAIPTYSNVLIKVFNLNGQEVSELYNGMKEPGFHTVSWSPKNSKSQRLSSGVYIIQIISQSNEQIKMKSEKVIFLQ